MKQAARFMEFHGYGRVRELNKVQGLKNYMDMVVVDSETGCKV